MKFLCANSIIANDKVKTEKGKAIKKEEKCFI